MTLGCPASLMGSPDGLDVASTKRVHCSRFRETDWLALRNKRLQSVTYAHLLPACSTADDNAQRSIHGRARVLTCDDGTPRDRRQ